MSLEHIRVDDRLIHGQVVTGWTRKKGIKVIIAVDDATAKNKMQCQLMKMATPVGVASYILTVDEAKERIDACAQKKVMLLVREPKTLLELLDRGVEIKEVNIGNQRLPSATEKLLNYVFSSVQDIAVWKQIASRGVKMTAQAVPDSQSVNFNELLKKY